jgi:hypothetical protein
MAIMTLSLLALAWVLGILLGWLSWRFWVVGLFGLVTGLVVGWSASVLVTWLGARRPMVVGALAVVVAWTSLQVAEDGHHRRAYAMQLAERRAHETGLSPAEATRLLAIGGLDYLAGDADEVLDREVERDIGSRGVIARWLYRAEKGVRLAGSWREGRALPVGVVGVVLTQLLELAMAMLIALRIVRRAERAITERAIAEQPPEDRLVSR